MNASLSADLHAFSEILQHIQTYSAAWLEKLPETPAGKELPVFSRQNLPETGTGALAVLQHLHKKYNSSFVATAGPRYFGFVTGGVTPASLAGDWLTSLFDHTPTGNDNAATFIEVETIHLLKQLFGLPDSFFGCFVTGATMANFVGLALARQWWGEQLGINVAVDGVGKLADLKVVVCAPHASIPKVLSMLGIGRNNLVRIPALPGREAVDIEAFTQYLEQHQGQPLIFSASAVTVNTVDFDDLEKLAALKAKYNFWLHVDAAFGGLAACVPEYRHLVKGWQEADSITIDAHKWLNVPYDAAMIFTRHPSLQREVFQNAGAAYLGDPEKDFNFIQYTPENSRRLRALPVWFSLLAYGREGYREIVENNIRLAQELGHRLTDSPRFRLLAPIRLCVVCFTLQVEGETALDALVSAFLQELTTRGRVFMTATTYNEIPAIRAALVNWRTQAEDIDITIQALNEAYEAIRVEKL
jgi:glutamate/tyrosine decarboxylase-like PLP-dependent enzyme